MVENKINKNKEVSADIQAYLQNIPMGAYRAKIDEIVGALKVQHHTFNNWRYGKAKMPELAKDKLEEFAGCKIFNR